MVFICEICPLLNQSLRIEEFFKTSLLKTAQEFLEDPLSNSYIKLLLVALALYLTWPVFLLSLDTPFALVDDLSDWRSITILSSLQGFLSYLVSTFDLDGNVALRPVFDISQAMAWMLFGENYSLHHLHRWI